jgi:hypothetical protein
VAPRGTPSAVERVRDIGDLALPGAGDYVLWYDGTAGHVGEFPQ